MPKTVEKQEISKTISNFIPHQLTSGQELLITILGRFLTTTTENPVLILKGYAGTGKTTIMSALVKASKKINIKTVLLAPTGRAAKVLSNYSNQHAQTIHRKIYITASQDGVIKLVSRRNFHRNTIFIVDEASMIGENNNNENSSYSSGNLLDDLISYVFSERGNKLILIGDTAQLPPVGLDISPALDQDYLRGSFPITTGSCFLNEVVRQEQLSGILYNATSIREKLQNSDFEQPYFSTAKFDDFETISGTDLIELLHSAYNNPGIENTTIICRSNKRANLFNQQIRNQVLMREDEIAAGDMIMVVKNNYFWLDEDSEAGFIANGEIGEILQVRGIEEQFGLRFANVYLRLIDYPNMEEIELKVLLNTLNSETASLSTKEYFDLFNKVEEDYMHIKNKQKRKKEMRNDPFLNALQIKFAYALTCHKTQGGQWHTIFIDQGYITPEMLDKSYLRWLYTAITRATSKSFLVNFNDEFFID